MVSDWPAVAIAGVRVHALDLPTAARTIVQSGLRRHSLSVHLCNAFVLALASQDEGYAHLLDEGDLNLADGAPVAWFAARAGLTPGNRPSGAELVDEVARLGTAYGLRHYFYGSRPEVVTRLAEVLRERHTGLEVVGVYAPDYGPVTEEQVQELAGHAQARGAHVVWVGLGTPKQDEFVDRLSRAFPGACVPVGAAFDFIAGSVPRAPAWMRQAGLEWVHRLAMEPRRLWKRYLWGNLRFLWAVARTGRVLDGPDRGPT
jgi:N-acetylglucosaminyldiphosphoundecaprenol N-acetyl-beta-D-mannosaminyltransferase